MAGCSARRRSRRSAHPSDRAGIPRGMSGPTGTRNFLLPAASPGGRSAWLGQVPVSATTRTSADHSSSASRAPSIAAPDHAWANCRSGCNATSSRTLAPSFNARSAASRPTPASSARNSAIAIVSAPRSRVITPRASKGSSRHRRLAESPVARRTARQSNRRPPTDDREMSAAGLPCTIPATTTALPTPPPTDCGPRHKGNARRPAAGRWRARDRATDRYLRLRWRGSADRREAAVWSGRLVTR